MIVSWQKLEKTLELKEQKKQWKNMIIGWKKLEKKRDVKEHKKQLNNMIIGWNNIEWNKKLLGREKHPWKLKVEELQMLLDSEQPG